jgi:hypothetical protein
LKKVPVQTTEPAKSASNLLKVYLHLSAGILKTFTFQNFWHAAASYAISLRTQSVTGFRAPFRVGRHPKSSPFRAATVVCLILLALLFVVQVAHVHALDSDADHCTLCAVMHSVVPLVVMLITVVLVRIGTPTPAALEVRAVTRYWHFTLFTRPPPAGC